MVPTSSSLQGASLKWLWLWEYGWNVYSKDMGERTESPCPGPSQGRSWNHTLSVTFHSKGAHPSEPTYRKDTLIEPKKASTLHSKSLVLHNQSQFMDLLANFSLWQTVSFHIPSILLGTKSLINKPQVCTSYIMHMRHSLTIQWNLANCK